MFDLLFLVVSDKDVMDLEKAYWALKASNSKFDLDTFREIISPPLPTQLCDSECSLQLQVYSIMLNALLEK